MCPMPRTILIVDDDPHIRQLLVFAFSKAGLDTIEASDGEAALALVQMQHPDLVLLDINMPRMDGLEVCRRLRAQGDIPIFFLSSRDDEIDRVLGIELGADDYVVKPFSPREVVARSMAILRRTACNPPRWRRWAQCGTAVSCSIPAHGRQHGATIPFRLRSQSSQSCAPSSPCLRASSHAR